MTRLHTHTAPPAAFNMTAYVLGAGGDADTALEILHAGHTETWTYAALRAAVFGVARGLRDSGLTPGDRVLMRLDNSVEFPITFLACLAADLVPIPTAAALTAGEVTKMLAEVTPAAIVAAPGVPVPDTTVPVITPEALAQMHALPPLAPHLGDPNRLGYIIYTSGSGGTPKAVCHAHRAIWARHMMWDGWYGLRPTDRLLHAGAFNWTYTLGTGLMDPWSRGATALIPAPGTSATDLPALLARAKASIFAAAPGVYRQMLRSPVPPLPTLRHGLSAGEKLPAETRAQWRDATGTAIYEALGMSECSTFISGSPDRPAPPGTAGYPQPGRNIAVLDDAGNPAPYGTHGTLAVATTDPGLMLGYWMKTAPQPVEGQWFLTGDTVSMAADGALTYHGRNDDMMNAGGFRVSPLEVEAALADLPGITELAVTEVPVASGATIIAAFYTAATDLPEAELTAQAATRLARYKQPRAWHRLPALPRNANGKINRRALRAAGAPE